jgi:hypothetical protein
MPADRLSQRLPFSAGRLRSTEDSALPRRQAEQVCYALTWDVSSSKQQEKDIGRDTVPLQMK